MERVIQFAGSRSLLLGVLSPCFLVFALGIGSHANASSIVDGWVFGFDMPGTRVSLTLSPPLPAPGQPFQVSIAGTATQQCPPLGYEVVVPAVVLPPAFPTPELRINANTRVCDNQHEGSNQCTNQGECDPDELPIDFSERIDVPAEFWDTLPLPEDLLIRLYVQTGTRAINADPPVLRDTSASWVQRIDLQRGAHVVPPRLGSGLWVSDEWPNEGVLVQQQGDRVVFYRLGYGPELTDLANLVGSWVYADAAFTGDSGNGLSVRFARPDPDDAEVVMEEILSSSIVVDDVNHIRVMFDAGPREPGNELRYTAWRRFNFSRDRQNLPAVIPDFSGGWTLLRFDGGTELARDTLTLGEGAWLDTNRWRFASLDGPAVLICKVDNRGDGGCAFEQGPSAETMRFGIENFNGNLAEGVFLDADGSETDVALFLRQPFALPVRGE